MRVRARRAALSVVCNPAQYYYYYYWLEAADSLLRAHAEQR